MKRVHIWISGSVQDMGYRSFVRERAFELSIKGWVRNLPDGRVEAVFEGESTDIEKIIILCKKGPPRSSVTNIEEKEEEPENLKGFEIRH